MYMCMYVLLKGMECMYCIHSYAVSYLFGRL